MKIIEIRHQQLRTTTNIRNRQTRGILCYLQDSNPYSYPSYWHQVSFHPLFTCSQAATFKDVSFSRLREDQSVNQLHPPPAQHAAYSCNRLSINKFSSYMHLLKGYTIYLYKETLISCTVLLNNQFNLYGKKKARVRHLPDLLWLSSAVDRHSNISIPSVSLQSAVVCRHVSNKCHSFLTYLAIFLVFVLIFFLY